MMIWNRNHSAGRHLKDVLLGVNPAKQRQKEGGLRILAELWALRLHRNDKLFNGRVASTDGVAYAAESLVQTVPQTRARGGLM